MHRSASEYVDDLKQEFKNDRTISGIAEQAFIAGRTLPAIALQEIKAMIDSGELVFAPKNLPTTHEVVWKDHGPTPTPNDRK